MPRQKRRCRTARGCGDGGDLRLEAPSSARDRRRAGMPAPRSLRATSSISSGRPTACSRLAGDAAARRSAQRRSGPASRPTARRWRSCGRCRGGIEEQVGQAVPREMLRQGRAPANTRRPGSIPRTLRGRTEIADRRVVGRASSHSTLPSTLQQDPHPDIEDCGRDLESYVEAAEHEALRRQAGLGAGGRACPRSRGVSRCTW